MNKYPTIPCELNKCILYPICKSKSRISCNELSIYLKVIREILHEDNTSIIYKSWDHIIQFLPGVESIEEISNPKPISEYSDICIRHISIQMKPKV